MSSGDRKSGYKTEDYHYADSRGQAYPLLSFVPVSFYIHFVYVFFRMLADNGVAEDGTRVMSRNAVKLLRRGQAPTTVNRFLSYGTRPRENGRFIGLDSTPELDAVANPDTGECAVWLCECGGQGAARPTELKEQVWKESRPLRAGVFVGVGSMGLSSTELIRYVARSPELDLTLVDGADLRNGALNGLDLLVVPGSGFGAPGHVRISYCVPTDRIRRALPVFEKLAAQYR